MTEVQVNDLAPISPLEAELAANVIRLSDMMDRQGQLLRQAAQKCDELSCDVDEMKEVLCYHDLLARLVHHIAASV